MGATECLAYRTSERCNLVNFKENTLSQGRRFENGMLGILAVDTCIVQLAGASCPAQDYPYPVQLVVLKWNVWAITKSNAWRDSLSSWAFNINL